MSRWSALLRPCVASVVLAGCPSRSSPARPDAPVAVVHALAHDGAADLAAVTLDAGPPPPIVFAPRMHCRATGPGHNGPAPHVTLYFAGEPLHRGARVRGRIQLADGRFVLRLAGSDPAAVTVVVTTARGDETARRTFALRPRALDLLAEDARGPALAQWDGTTLTLDRLTGPTDAPSETVTGFALPATPPVCAIAHDPLALTAMVPDPPTMPRFTGVPPLTAQEARWVLSHDATGTCLAGYEALGPWGVVRLDVTEHGLTGTLSLADAKNPVACEPMATGDAGTATR